jgi:cell division protein FtsQ
VAVPLARRLPRLTGTGLVLAFFGATGIYGLVASGQYAELRDTYGEPRDIAARAFGFGLDKITISGIAQLTEREVLKIAGINSQLSLPFVSASEIRARLERTPLVKGAIVRKLYPNELAITLIEREAYALWQLNGELSIVAADGTVVDRMNDPRFATLPLVVGEGANKRAASYVALLEAAGPLRSKIRAGTLISGRRWNLKMENGLDVRLPEENAPAAVARLVKLEREQGILEKDILAVDLRLPDRVVVRLTEEAALARAEVVKKRPGRGTKGAET